MKVKKYASSMLVLGLCFVSSMNISFANENKNIEPDNTKSIIDQQISAFNEIDKKIRENSSEIGQSGKNQSRSARSIEGRYPTDPGAILVTSDGVVDKLIGHAGIVYNSTTTVESNTEKGVATYPNTWNTSRKSVYGLLVKNSSPQKDQDAANYAYTQIGKPYNWNFFNTETTDSFYCSQLVYRAYKEVTGINLNYNGGMVTPADLIDSPETSMIYSQRQ
ncbi:YiiX/YebB-like N1pC/P60 family cysteine hydrolase [Paraclostridium ghonii]|uniref:Uncharacterized protein YycO n=1 Tax=Paraclostridium ghonii TaxID=29358 RepID=A0ABU0N420_9FIRM|nr:YiiX/YebB-like N1pC/P60 family cysteine hydrolase [Paeniclostridium ghonii]MDQ0557911.1 uncharacterized protein YycO [Paeniclostridium ghonii]